MSQQQADNFGNTQAGSSFVCEQTPTGWWIAFHSADGQSEAGIEPLSLLDRGVTTAGRWDTVTQTGNRVLAAGAIRHDAGSVTYFLEADAGRGGEPITLHWRVYFDGGPFTGAIRHTVKLAGVVGDPLLLDLPGVHYAANTYGTGIFPHPDPSRGFSFRADRMPQPAIHYRAPLATWSYFAADEAAKPPQPDLLYCLGVDPPEDADSPLSMFFRYPQMEYGHRGDGGIDAYVAKDTFAPGEEVEATWQPGDELEKTLYLWSRPPGDAQDYGPAARFLWQRAYPLCKAPRTTSLIWQAGQHIRWFNARLFNRQIGGGQYESPEGSNTAMLGFVEQSILMASVTLNYVNFVAGSQEPSLPQGELERLRGQATGAISRWVEEGRTVDGLLFPACDSTGYHFGYRNYADYADLGITHDDVFDTIRPATEASSLLEAAESERIMRLGAAHPDTARWEQAAVDVADWLIQHPLPTGGYSSRYNRAGQAVDPYPGGTGATLALFCDVARMMRARGSRSAESYLREAVEAYDSAFAGMVRSKLFAGGTLDASTPDREAAVAALNACLQVYELTGKSEYLEDAGAAADNLLSYTFVYPITTFGRETDAVKQGISTFGATLVSPENQHLDPVSTAPSLILYGLYTGDEIFVQAGIEALRWTLDGRWAIKEPEGYKQSEQLLHTRWYYNTFFTQRGDYRRGMPLWGRTSSEHGWPQVVPSSAFLATGQVLADWLTGRAAGVDTWDIQSVTGPADDKLQIELSKAAILESEQTGGLYLRVVRLPWGSNALVTLNGATFTLSAAQLGHGHMLPLTGTNRASLSVELASV